MKNSEEPMDDMVFEETTEEGEVVSHKDKIKSMREALVACKQERQEYLDGWQRARADYSNAQKELEETKTRAKSLAEEQLLEELVPVLDSFYYAFNNKEAWEAVDANWRQGIEYIHSQLKGVLEAHHLSAFEDLGKSFDPLRHQAVTEIETENETQAGTIASVLKPGYLYRDSVLRPATVSVYKFKNS